MMTHEAMLIFFADEEVEAFIYLTLYLKMLILGRMDNVQILKEVVVKEEEKQVVGFLWIDVQEATFNYIKASI